MTALAIWGEAVHILPQRLRAQRVHWFFSRKIETALFNYLDVPLYGLFNIRPRVSRGAPRNQRKGRSKIH